jgi:hypothetical protein
MSIGFKDPVSEFNTTTAHAPHRLALARLMQILASLLDRNSHEQEYILQWSRNPEEFDLRFLRSDSGSLLFEVYEYPTAERGLAERNIVFSHLGNVQEVCNSFAETFETLYEDRETDEFEFNWHQPFPIREYELFNQSLLRYAKDPD